jgi:hypothetical protein
MLPAVSFYRQGEMEQGMFCERLHAALIFVISLVIIFGNQ